MIKFQPNMLKQEKKSIIWITPKTRQKYSEIIYNSWPSSNPDLNFLDYALWVIFENKTNIGSLKIAIGEE